MDNIELAFLQDNARMEDDDFIVNNFIETNLFWKLFTTNHQVLCGSRGSGKTALTKMASYPFLVKYNNPKAKSIVNELKTIGVFLNTDIRFVGSLTNKAWYDEDFGERYFIWKFNINCFKAFTKTLSALLEKVYKEKLERIRVEQLLVNSLTTELFKEELNLRLVELPDYISNYEFKVRQNINRSYLTKNLNKSVLMDSFSTELFEPIQFAIRKVSAQIEQVKDTNWLFFIDEGEFLTESHHRIINSFMRTSPDRVFIKLATLPYYHHTLETNIGVHVQPDEDFEYIYLDSDPISELNDKTRGVYNFASTLYKRRVEHFINMNKMNISSDLIRVITNLDSVLGKSPVSAKFDVKNNKQIIERLSNYLNEPSIERAKKKLQIDFDLFDDEILRKVKRIVYLIDDKRKAIGRTAMDSYSGVEMAVRCTDGVPRKMINLFQEIAKLVIGEVTRHSNNNKPQTILTRKKQTRLLKSYSNKRYHMSMTVPKKGPKLIEFIDAVGKYMEHKTHGEKIGTDIIGSFSVGQETSEELWSIIKTGIAFGFIFPNTVDRLPDLFLKKEGSFRPSFSLSPHFNIYPRKGATRSVNGILKDSIEKSKRQNSQTAFNFGER